MEKSGTEPSPTKKDQNLRTLVGAKTVMNSVLTQQEALGEMASELVDGRDMSNCPSCGWGPGRTKQGEPLK